MKYYKTPFFTFKVKADRVKMRKHSTNYTYFHVYFNIAIYKHTRFYEKNDNVWTKKLYI